MNMRIGFDATTTQLTKGGTTVYFNHLLDALQKNSPQNEYILFSTGRPDLRNKIVLRQIDTLYRELYWQQRILPKLAKINCIDILHCPAHLVPLKADVPRVVTFHDIYILKNPPAFRIWGSLLAKYIYPKIIHSGCHIIADTYFTKKEIMTQFNVAGDNITVIHLGLDRRFNTNINNKDLERVKTKYRLPNEYLLYVGAIEPRKNIQRLVDAVQIVNRSIDIPLVLVSYGGWKNKPLYQYIEKLGNKVILLKNIDGNELPVLYKLATLFVSPSLYEGFGLPLLEAMACGCPSAVSHCEAHKEIGNDAALYFNPTDIEDIVEKIMIILNSSDIAKQLTKRGIPNSKKYSWDKCAEKTLDVYKSLL